MSSLPAKVSFTVPIDEGLPVAAHADVAGGDGDLQALLGPPPAALLQLRRVPGARVHPRAEPGQLFDDRVPDPLTAAGDERRRSGEGPPLLSTPAGSRRHSLLQVQPAVLDYCQVCSERV